MRHLLISVLLFAVVGVAFAQKNGNQPAAARTSDVEALSAAVADLTARVSRLEGTGVTSATVAGTYALAGLEVEVPVECGGCNPDFITQHSTPKNTTMVLNATMTYVINGGAQGANIHLEVVDNGTSPARLASRTSRSGEPITETGIWSVAGKEVTLIPAGGGSSKTFLITGPNLLVSGMQSNGGLRNSLQLAVRQ